MSHIVLLGDSIFDNGSYVAENQAVIDHLRALLPEGWSATLAAVDGDKAAEVGLRLGKVPADATHLIVSVGGNDALGVSGSILDGVAASFAVHMAQLFEIREKFEAHYVAMLDGVLAFNRPVAVCTIYDAVPGLSPALNAGLSLFNDVIVKTATRKRVNLIDLRHVCPEARDYAAVSPIEPSEQGGKKIARAIVRYLLPDPTEPPCRIIR